MGHSDKVPFTLGEFESTLKMLMPHLSLFVLVECWNNFKLKTHADLGWLSMVFVMSYGPSVYDNAYTTPCISNV